VRCQATTARGEPCRRPAQEGSERCFSHLGGPVGRPDGLTDEVVQRILVAVRSGSALEVAAQAAGISRATLHRWRARGEREKAGKFREFADALARAEAEAEAHLVALIVRAGDQQWQAAAWILARRFSNRWGQGQDGRRLSEMATPAGDSDLDMAEPGTRRLLSELLARRPADRSG
jgi:hypothetical protein